MKRILTAAIVTLVMTGTALANQCPKDMAEIDAAMAANSQITAEQKAEVVKLRAEGEALHKAGDHAASIETLAKAKEILGLK